MFCLTPTTLNSHLYGLSPRGRTWFPCSSKFPRRKVYGIFPPIGGDLGTFRLKAKLAERDYLKKCKKETKIAAVLAWSFWNRNDLVWNQNSKPADPIFSYVTLEVMAWANKLSEHLRKPISQQTTPRWNKPPKGM